MGRGESSCVSRNELLLTDSYTAVILSCKMVAGGPCVVCSEEVTTLTCTTCSLVRYCSTTCQVQDTNSKHHQCLPYTILHENRCGRLLMASRDISAGEVLFNDIPGAVGPDNNPKPV